ncbi:UDP-N-acetylmuramoyl-L-alanyl-D-glutamate--2,6-diaminopimelate ligase [Actinospica durhamensis]|uniref:UDP-N-acetylmuramoyl-L-alanyl-D-glutamate--2,6-diaminopimelate ligase n=1 Tax=Actinospica durhamensis TaxID=1508375 RepID=A0A941INC1_9ACTN|nr:UDP-N-acetylmuramoyl-L-alanyl-D-glutamate--2,6-diaminopimelate ligase [Actinospica durhamensis]MBR7831852.1 UDP-N-acetylmuramoyl-L-alanyl-D-glutamate--2,6-diaminopimelate ligase [Actinospica durhamensis]
MKLADLLDQHPYRLVRGTLEIEITAPVTADTRSVERGSLFVAVAGRRHDGHALLQEAFDKGAVAALVTDAESRAPEGMTVVRVPDTLAAASHVAARQQGEPGRSMVVVSITGTNGKTSVAAMLESILSSLSPAPVGVIGTGGTRVDLKPLPLSVSTPTTPQAIELQAILRAMADRQVGTLVMEASSLALFQHRVDHAFTDIGVFTNLSPDHLDDHGSMDAYRQAKMLLFSGLAGLAVANADDPVSAEIHTLMPGRVTSFGIEQDADYRATDIQISPAGTTFTLHHRGREYRAKVPVPARFAVSNALAAIAVCGLLGYELDRVLPALEALGQIPGRMQTLRLPNGTTVVIDYAHSPDSLEKVLDTLRELAGDGRLITVFGCGGDRDPGKRAPMGVIAGRLSDHVIITSDNPRTEDPESILDAIERGLSTTDATYDRLPDRREAIARALGAARPGDTALIAGKGNEDYQIIGDRTTPFQDIAVVRELSAEPIG